MVNIIELDDLAYDLILSHLVYIDRLNLSLTCRTLQFVVRNSPQQALNCTLLDDVPIQILPFASDHHLVDHATWRSLKRSQGTNRNDVYLSRLCWNSRHIHFNETSLRHVILDGTNVNVLDVIHFLTAAPLISYLSVRFCVQVNRLLLQNFLDSTAEKQQLLHLQRLDVIGIDGLSFFEPLNNGGTLRFDEREIELIGAGPEYDYLDLWRETMYDFKMSLERVSTWHGRKICTDIARCSQSYCRNFDVGRRELADPTIESTLPTCYLCQTPWIIPICRACIAARSCNICKTFICPKCKTTSCKVSNGSN